ncbi:MAG: hypothetical protein P4L26_05965 [Terracidiphilus sp.]|nr:hypothetical protein [Terracidiphilus sp.]
MLRRTLFTLACLVAGLGLVTSSLTAHGQDETSKRGRKYKSPPPTARIEVTILKDVNGKPIENAAVIFHPMEGEKDKGNMELKTNEDGKTVIDVLPLGDTVRLQVIARGFQTFGDDYKVDKAEMGIEIRMKRPGEQYSIYKDHPAKPDDGSSKVTTPSPKPAASAPAEPSTQTGTPPAAAPNPPASQPQSN